MENFLSQKACELCSDLGDLRSYHGKAVALVGVFVEIILVVILGLEVFAQRGNFGDYVWTPDILGSLDGIGKNFLLRFTRVKHR